MGSASDLPKLASLPGAPVSLIERLLDRMLGPPPPPIAPGWPACIGCTAPGGMYWRGISIGCRCGLGPPAQQLIAIQSEIKNEPPPYR